MTNKLIKVREFEGGRVETFATGLVLARLSGELGKENTEHLYLALENIYENWYQERGIMLLIDLLGKTVTPYFRQKLMSLRAVAQAAALTTRIAIMVDASARRELDVIANISALGSKQRLRIFTEEAEAKKWLEEGID